MISFFFTRFSVEDENGEFSKEVKHWKNADYDKNNFLDQHEFLAFRHPEHNKQAIEMMADEIIPTYDKDQDGVSFMLLKYSLPKRPFHY